MGLSPDGGTLYVVETETGRVWSWEITAPGEVPNRPWPSPHGGTIVAGVPGYSRLDSLAIAALGIAIPKSLLVRAGEVIQ